MPLARSRSMDRIQRSITATIGGRSAESGSGSSRRWRRQDRCLKSSASIPVMSKRTARPLAQKGGVHGSGWALARRKNDRRTPYPLDQKTYRRRSVIERMFCKLKNWRRIATRYDRHAITSQASHSPPSCVSVDLNESPMIPIHVLSRMYGAHGY
jgi:transposase